ncbi:hypothetical protein [Sphingobium sp.]|uniref:hypothetical protein n=1 Tax=Sphingobium sp. TaxID=1912891 RepID=UPI003B3A6487
MTDRRTNAAKWALHAHYSRMLGKDGQLMAQRQQAGTMTADLVGEIAKEYDVTRSIPVVCPQWGPQSNEAEWVDRHRALIAAAINDTAWDSDIATRAGQCRTLVQSLADAMAPSLKKDRKTTVSFASGLTKLSWFDAPDGRWTLFDKYARRAVIGSGTGDALDKMKQFYKALEERGFNDVFDAISQAIAPLNVPLHPGKIIDHYLMACCPDKGETSNDFNLGNQATGELLDRYLIPEAAALLNTCARKVEQALIDTPLAKAA